LKLETLLGNKRLRLGKKEFPKGTNPMERLKLTQKCVYWGKRQYNKTIHKGYFGWKSGLRTGERADKTTLPGKCMYWGVKPTQQKVNHNNYPAGEI
jgi:hypothetical protein